MNSQNTEAMLCATLLDEDVLPEEAAGHLRRLVGENESLRKALERLYAWALAQQGGCLFYGHHPMAQAAFALSAAPEAPAPQPLTRQQISDRFGFLEGLVSESTYLQIVDAAAALQQPVPVPLTDEQIEPLFRDRKAMEVAGEKDAWYWYAWGISDGERAHGIGKDQP